MLLQYILHILCVGVIGRDQCVIVRIPPSIFSALVEYIQGRKYKLRKIGILVVDSHPSFLVISTTWYTKNHEVKIFQHIYVLININSNLRC